MPLSRQQARLPYTATRQLLCPGQAKYYVYVPNVPSYYQARPGLPYSICIVPYLICQTLLPYPISTLGRSKPGPLSRFPTGASSAGAGVSSPSNASSGLVLVLAFHRLQPVTILTRTYHPMFNMCTPNRYTTNTEYVLYPCSTKRREGLENPSPTPKISRDPRDFPRAKLEGNLEGGGDGFPNTS